MTSNFRTLSVGIELDSLSGPPREQLESRPPLANQYEGGLSGQQVETTTAVSCIPSTGTVGVFQKCTATVSNIPTFFGTLPGGTVTFSGTLPPGMPPSCTLASSGSCSVSWTPALNGSYSIATTYGGDTTHASSVSASTALKT